MFSEVYLFDAPYHIDRPFDYEAIPDLEVGDIVRVPFGRNNSTRLGVVVGMKERADSDNIIKPVHSVVCGRFSLNEEMLGLCLFMKEHTLSTFGEAARCILPPGALSDRENLKIRRVVYLEADADEVAVLLSDSEKGRLRGEGQRRLLEYLSEIGQADYELILKLPSVTSQTVKTLRERGIIRIGEFEELRNPYYEYARVRDEREIVLTPAQSAAYDTLRELYSAGDAKAGLLWGVTGSGKTKVIMKMIDGCLKDKKTVIMLVPEISLTPQTVSIFCSRYGERVAVVHSSLSVGERQDAWRRIKRGEVDLVIGTRSAIFAPLDNIGMIVIDEEHEHTYKSESDPKYHARDIAAFRCRHHCALMLLASATPSLESFYKAKSGKYTLVPLRERYGGFKLPDAVIVDMREELRLGNTTPISERLRDTLLSVSERDEQAILFLNRRGYNSEVSCKACGEVISCPRCSVSLTHHTGKRGNKMLCHFCGHTEPVPRICPACGADKLSFIGYGTQKVEGELNANLPDMTVMRMDADTTQGKLSYDRMLEDFRLGRADILLGTQMVAKGHDFPRVTLVGVVLADTSLYVSDFRAAERTFSLLTQVIGRAGRASDRGVAVIQTFAPKNEIIRLACMQDYEKFYEGEIALRRELSYPPFCDMVSLTLTGSNEREVLSEAGALSRSMISKLEGEYSGLPFVVFGPFEAEVYRINEKYRMKMMVKCRLNSKTRGLFRELLSEYAQKRGVTLAVDINPLS